MAGSATCSGLPTRSRPNAAPAAGADKLARENDAKRRAVYDDFVSVQKAVVLYMQTLSLLAGEGLVEIRPRRGAVVATLSPQRLVEMFEVMAELEAMCARLAARRAKDCELARLHSLLALCEDAAKAQDPDAYFYANEDFHQAIYTASHNDYLTEQASALQRKLRPYRRLQLRVRNRMQRSLQEHAAVLESIRAAEPEQAALQLRNHVVVQGDRFADLLAEMRQFEESPVSP